MKKTLLCALALMLTLCVALAETWYCPNCGEKCTKNFCPVCGTSKDEAFGEDDYYDDYYDYEDDYYDNDYSGGTMLTEMEIFDSYNILAGSDEIYDPDILKDMEGNVYESEDVIVRYYGWWGGHTDAGYVEYFLDYEYNNLSFRLYLPWLSRAKSNQSMFKVYGDEKLIYTAPQFGRGANEILDVNLDVSGIRVLRIETDGYWREGLNSAFNPMVVAANLNLY